MAKTVTISDDLAALLEARQKQVGYGSLDETAEAFIAQGLAANDANEDHSLGYTDDELRVLIDEAEKSGDPLPWDDSVLERIAHRNVARMQKRK